MIKSITIIIFVLSAFMLTAQKNLSKSINSLSFNLLNKLNTENENVLISAYSISGALALTYAGAKNETKSEMGKVLFPYIKNDVSSDFYSLNESLGFNKKLELLSANAIWLENTYKLKKRYAKDLLENFKSELNKADFISTTGREDARKNINQWVEKQTKEMITDFLPPNVLSESTTMVLVNAIYFLGKWKTEFPEANSYEADFTNQMEKTACKFMKNTMYLAHYSDDSLSAVKIPYENDEASLIVILPKDKNQKLSGLLDNLYFNKIYRNFKREKVELHLPKFKMESEYELNSYLKELGLKSAFGSSADFSGITGKKEIHISNILHKAVIELDESGTEASAATAVITSRSASVGIHTRPVLFKADHPFIFLIRENSTGTILFMGNLVNPTIP